MASRLTLRRSAVCESARALSLQSSDEAFTSSIVDGDAESSALYPPPATRELQHLGFSSHLFRFQQYFLSALKTGQGVGSFLPERTHGARGPSRKLRSFSGAATRMERAPSLSLLPRRRRRFLLLKDVACVFAFALQQPNLFAQQPPLLGPCQGCHCSVSSLAPLFLLRAFSREGSGFFDLQNAFVEQQKREAGHTSARCRNEEQRSAKAASEGSFSPLPLRESFSPKALSKPCVLRSHAQTALFLGAD